MTGREGRCLGLIGGLGPGATVHYYRGLLAAHAAQGRVARMLIAHADVDHGRPLAEANKLDELARYLAGFIDSTAAGGAEMAAIVAVTPHICTAQLLPLLRIPLIDMVAEVAREVRARGLKRIALFGTRPTVESRMFGTPRRRCRHAEIPMKSTSSITPIWMSSMTAARQRQSTDCASLHTRWSNATARRPCCWPEPIFRWF